MKRFFVVFLAAVLMVGLFPATVFADNNSVGKGIVVHGTVLTQNGSVIQWGLGVDGRQYLQDKNSAPNADNVLQPGKFLNNVAEIVYYGGVGHGGYLMKNGDYVVCEAIGTDHAVKTIKPTVVMKNVKSVSSTGYGFVIKNDNSLWRNVGFLQVAADGTVSQRSDLPVEKVMDNVVAADGNYALRTDGNLWEIYPQRKFMDNIKDFHANGYALKNDGSLWSWGSNHWGRLGSGTVGDNVFVQNPVQIMSNVKTISVSNRIYALKNDGTLWGWGYNGTPLGDTFLFGRRTGGFYLGDGSTVEIQNKPVKIMDGVQSVDAEHCLAIKTDGSLWSWRYDAPGNGQRYNTGNRPVKIMDNIVAAGDGIAVKSDGSVWAWGQNNANYKGTSMGSPYHVFYNGKLCTGSKQEYVLTPEQVRGVSVK